MSETPVSDVRRVRRVYQTIFVLGAVMFVMALVCAAVALGVLALICAGCAAWGAAWMVLVLFAASEDENLD